MKNGIFLAVLVFACAVFCPPSPQRRPTAQKVRKSTTPTAPFATARRGLATEWRAAALDPKPRDLSSAAILETYTDEYLVNVITNGGAGGRVSLR